MKTNPTPANNRYYLGSYDAMIAFMEIVTDLPGVTVYRRDQDSSVRIEAPDMRKIGPKILAAYHKCSLFDDDHIEYLPIPTGGIK